MMDLEQQMEQSLQVQAKPSCCLSGEFCNFGIPGTATNTWRNLLHIVASRADGKKLAIS